MKTERKVVTLPPITGRHFWSAMFEGYDPITDYVGHGGTEADAIADLRKGTGLTP